MYFDEAKAPFLAVRPKVGTVVAISGLFVLLFVVLPWPLVEAAYTAAGSFKY